MKSKMHIQGSPLKKGIKNLKQFVVSLIATSISIVLTFGTAAWIDNRKKEAAKREMVMMILYDLSNSLEKVASADSLLHAGFEQQLAVAENPKLLEQNPFIFISYVPYFSYTETVEHIFSSTIETIETLGNVLFIETVSDLYMLRKQYKEDVCDQFLADFEENEGYKAYEDAIEINYDTQFIPMSEGIYDDMKTKFALCQQMMNVSDADLQAYRQKRQEMASSAASESGVLTRYNDASQNNKRLQDAIEKGKANK